MKHGFQFEPRANATQMPATTPVFAAVVGVNPRMGT
jgi:hypothetical protein